MHEYYECMQEYARVCKSMQECMSIMSMQEYARVLSVQEYARVCKSMQQYYECMQEYARVCKSMQEYARVCKSISLVPRHGGGGGEKVPGTHCLRMRLIITEFRGNCVCMYTGDIINSLR